MDPSRPSADASNFAVPPSAATNLRPEDDARRDFHGMTGLPSPEHLTELLPGRNFVAESFIGQGGMGAVYRGFQINLNRPVAIKILELGHGADFDFADRFRREAEAMASLSHPHIVAVHDFGSAGMKYLYLVMEFVDGTDLTHVLRAGQMNQDLALYLLPQVCDALGFAHERGLVHRDIKPANILITSDWRVKVADFGLAKKMDPAGTLLTRTNLIMGTAEYAAPEQMEGAPDVDGRADIYSLGVTMYQMLTGELPRGAWQPPSTLVRVDPRLDPIVTRAMMPRREQRFRFAGEMSHQIVALAHTMAYEKAAAATAHAPVALQPRLAASRAAVREAVPRTKKPPMAMFLGLGSAMVVLALGAWHAFTPQRLPTGPGIAPGFSERPPSSSPVFPASQQAKQTTAPLPKLDRSKVDDGVPWRSIDLNQIDDDDTHHRDRYKHLADGTLNLVNAGWVWDSRIYKGDVAARARFRRGPDSGTSDFRLMVRDQAGANYSAANTGRLLRYVWHAGATVEPAILASFPPISGVGSHTLELRAAGDRLTVVLDGAEVAEAQDGGLSEGRIGLLGSNIIVESLEYQVPETR